jgi:hypothetical protein
VPIYFVQGAGLTKIGYADSPLRRLRHLQGASPAPLTLARVLDGSKHDEVRLHRLFADVHSHAEWFRLTREQIFADFGLRDIEIAEENRNYLPKLRRHPGVAVSSHPYLAAGTPA